MMKKISAVLAAAALLTVMAAGCEKKEGKSEAPASAPTSTPTSTTSPGTGGK